jgi:hypothetical protein
MDGIVSMSCKGVGERMSKEVRHPLSIQQQPPISSCRSANRRGEDSPKTYPALESFLQEHRLRRPHTNRQTSPNDWLAMFNHQIRMVMWSVMYLNIISYHRHPFLFLSQRSIKEHSGNYKVVLTFRAFVRKSPRNTANFVVVDC